MVALNWIGEHDPPATIDLGVWPPELTVTYTPNFNFGATTGPALTWTQPVGNVSVEILPDPTPTPPPTPTPTPTPPPGEFSVTYDIQSTRWDLISGPASAAEGEPVEVVLWLGELIANPNEGGMFAESAFITPFAETQVSLESGLDNLTATIQFTMPGVNTTFTLLAGFFLTSQSSNPDWESLPESAGTFYIPPDNTVNGVFRWIGTGDPPLDPEEINITTVPEELSLSRQIVLADPPSTDQLLLLSGNMPAQDASVTIEPDD